MENNEKNFDEVKVEKIIRTDSYFDGKFIEYLGYKILALLISLISHFLLWYLLIIVTFGIYGIWLPMKVYGWKIKNTHIKLKDEEVEKESKLPYILSPILIVVLVILII